MRTEPLLAFAVCGLLITARPPRFHLPLAAVPGEGWTPGPILAIDGPRSIRLQLGDSKILWQGAAGPGQLRLFTMPIVPAPLPPPSPSQGPLIQIGPFLGAEGAERTTFVIGEPIRIWGKGFGAQPGAVFINGFRRPVSCWTDTEIVTSYDDANRTHRIWIGVRRADGRMRTVRSDRFPVVVAPDQLPRVAP